jgi:hypothetical protein
MSYHAGSIQMGTGGRHGKISPRVIAVGIVAMHSDVPRVARGGCTATYALESLTSLNYV